MSVLIDMDMPKVCNECPFCCNPTYFAYAWCELLHKHFDMNESYNKVADFCPLVEVPTHGDLIDKNELYEKVAKWETQALEQASKLAQTDNIEEWRRWSAILNERTAFKFDVADAPVVIKGDLQ